MIYRREIDGLRAVAVMPVVLFHAGFEIFSGGFIGVDIFFVISGYLITSILLTDLENNRFSLFRFYERRARRILPALTVVILTCVPFAYTWMMPNELKDFSQSIFAATFFASNFLFWWESGYFAPASETKPLLHTWSLAVEEQYYIIFPILLLVLWKYRKERIAWIFSATAFASLLLAEWGWRNAPSANFYLFPFRAWELLAGSLAAIFTRKFGVQQKQWISAIGFTLILLSIFTFDAKTPFPSFYAVIPVTGAALLLCFGGEGTLAAKLLGFRPLVFVGLISYSAYLWHQPVFAFARIRSVSEPTPYLMGALGVASFALAYLSWRFIENPFRNSKSGPIRSQSSVFLASGMAMAMALYIGLIGVFGQGFPGRTTPSGQSFASLKSDLALAPNYGLSPKCEGSFTLNPECRTGADPQIILWGDSFAMHLAQALKDSPSAVPMLQLTKSQCAPIPDMATIGSMTPWTDCLAFNDEALAYIEENQSAKFVAISSPFKLLNPETTIYLRDGSVASREHIRLITKAFRSLDKRVSRAGKKLVIVAPPPNTGQNFGTCLVHATLFKMSGSKCNFARKDMSETASRARSMLQKLEGDVAVVWLDNFMCDRDECFASMEGVPLYRDDGHLSIEGARFLGKKFDLADKVINAQRVRRIKFEEARSSM
ncbi:acyltransferase family protein [Pontixanthobacter sp.]|uniref:acyltransferase family protein n=1 Tax=Pontixanthobacter sp. TaxID=2792078 RepID=UPI003C7AFED7